MCTMSNMFYQTVSHLLMCSITKWSNVYATRNPDYRYEFSMVLVDLDLSYVISIQILKYTYYGTLHQLMCSSKKCSFPQSTLRVALYEVRPKVILDQSDSNWLLISSLRVYWVWCLQPVSVMCVVYHSIGW